jgi:hypothetical protein
MRYFSSGINMIALEFLNFASDLDYNVIEHEGIESKDLVLRY